MKSEHSLWGEKQGMPIAEALRIPRGITALIGGGGKTSLLYALGFSLSRENRVILSTSTRIYPPEGMLLLEDPEEADIQRAFTGANLLCTGRRMGEKLGPCDLPFSVLEKQADYLFIEADGAKGLPLKAHAPHEPVIPAGAYVVCVLGTDGFEGPIREKAHRPALYAAALGRSPEERVQPREALKLLKGDCLFLNKVETEERLLWARELAQNTKKRTVLGALKEGPLAMEIWEEGICVYSCGAPGIWPAAWR